jgi:putative addiction module component (TIGR02574 family)
MSDPARVLEDALGLEATDRARIARRLIRSLEQGDADADVLWRAEIKRRIDEIEAGTAELEDWDAVRGRLRAAVGR